MRMSVEELRRQVLDLPPEERRELAYEMLDSADDEEAQGDPAEVEAAWAEEIKRRVDEIDAGLVTPISSDEVFARMQARIDDAARRRAQV